MDQQLLLLLTPLRHRCASPDHQGQELEPGTGCLCSVSPSPIFESCQALFRDPWGWLTSTHFPYSELAMEGSPVSEGCDHQPPAVAEVLVAIDEFCIHSTDVQVIICPVVPSNVGTWGSGHGATGQ